MKYIAILLLVIIRSSALSQRKPAHQNGGRIINGVEAGKGEFPSQLSLRVNGSHVCGATIVSPSWALTAAHCVRGVLNVKPAELTLLAGTVNVDGSGGGTVHQATEIVIHEEYNPGDSWVNDITVVKVAVPFSVAGEAVGVGKLPVQGQDTADNSPATVIGWGATTVGGSFVPKLLKVDIVIVNREECRKNYSALGVTVYGSQLCAGVPEGGKGSCNMDSGGPLFVAGEVVGLVSWAYGCSTPGYPTVYTRVAQFRDWITGKTGV